jgi:pyruvate dehydrogenase E1 component alpha subunit
MKMDGKESVAVSFAGEAVAEEGIWAETLNFAAIHHLPLILVIENNLYSTESPLSTRQPSGTSLCERAETFKWRTFEIDGNNIEKVWMATGIARRQAVEDRTPVLIEAITYRIKEHVGPNEDWELGRTYRSKEELDEWKLKCPVKRSYDWMRDLGHTEEELSAIDHDIQAELVEQALRAREAPFPDKSTLMENVT